MSFSRLRRKQLAAPYHEFGAFKKSDMPTDDVDWAAVKAWREANKESGILRARIAQLETWHLLALARKYRVASPEPDRLALLGKPDDNSKWEVSPHLEDIEFILKREARTELRWAIHAARKERRETVRLWITTIIPSLTGLLGVIVALLALVLGRR